MKFKGFNHGPPVLAHEVAGEYTGCPTLPSDRVNQDTLALLVSIFDELKYLLSGDVVLVKEHLLLLV